MTVLSNSRYAQSKVVTLYTPSGQPRNTIVPGEQVPFVIQYQYYQVKLGDRVDQIAYTYYKDATRWWVFADANPQIMDWSSLAAGTLIRIPVSG